jgi:serine/threonine-protein kinase
LHWSAPVDSDRRAAWDGAIQGQPEVTFHIEAAAYRGRFVYFSMRGPWVEPPRAAAVDPTARVAVAGMIVFAGVVMLLAGMWTRRNLRLGRGDRKGAQRLAIFTFVSLALANLFPAAHTASPVVEFNLLVQIASQGLVVALLIWLFYIALEPTVRRRWPQTLISWTRVLAGRLRDPLVGRDVLVGLLAGMILVLALPFDLASLLLGRAPAMADNFEAPFSPRVLAYVLFLCPCMAVFWSVGFLFMLSLFQALLRRAWLGRLLLFLVFLAVGSAAGGDALATSVKSAILGAISILVLVRFGLLASATLLFTFTLLRVAPLTFDWSEWYAGRSFAVLFSFVAVLLLAFYTSLGGKPLFGRALLED